ncbi:hypothetical protein [Streptomyces sp. MN13]
MTYRDLATRPVLTWSLVAVAARMPVAMAPLAVVFLVRERPGGYSLGALLAAAYVLGEIVGRRCSACGCGPSGRGGR